MAPKQVENPELDELRNICNEYIKFVDGPDYHEDNDFKHYIFEKAVETIYGQIIWDFINEKTK
jgi:hypothetical protein